VQKVGLDRGVLLEAGPRDFIPPARVQAQGLAQAVCLPGGGAVGGGGGEGDAGGVGCACQSVRERLVLLWGRGGGCGGDGEVGALEVGGGEGGEVVPD
jgi:hypothetical protein